MQRLRNIHKEDPEVLLDFMEFFRSCYSEEIADLISNPAINSLEVDYEVLREYDSSLADNLVSDPMTYLTSAEEALRKFPTVSDNQSAHEGIPYDSENNPLRHSFLRVRNNPNILRVRDIRSEKVGELVTIEGRVNHSTDVLPRIEFAHFECESCGEERVIEQVEVGSVNTVQECSNCSSNMQLVWNKSKKVDFQKLEVQESQEDLRGGKQPKSIDVFVKGEEAGKVNSGEPVRATGVVEPDPREDSPVFDTYMRGNLLEREENDYEEVEYTEEDIEEIKSIASSEDVYEMVVASIAPDIKGAREPKTAAAFSLFGGLEKKEVGQHIRGDIHILLVGDPGTGKSRIIQYAEKVSPRGIYTSGKGISEAGLTAAAVRKETLGGEQEWTLEAGALVLADRGVAAVDEIDKMRKGDRDSMHEALEQQSYHPKTKILLPSGEKSIGDFVNSLIQENEEQVVDGIDCEILLVDDISVPGVNLFTDNIYEETVQSVSRHRSPDKMVAVKFSNGRKITVTPDHPIPIYGSEDEPIFVDAEHVVPGQAVPTPCSLPDCVQSPDEPARLGEEFTHEGVERVPPSILFGGERARRNFLRGYIENSGTFTFKNREKAESLCNLIMSLGWNPNISEDRGRIRVEWNKPDENSVHLDTHIESVDIIDNEKNQLCEWVYDVTVEPTNTFVSEGVVLHNTVSVNKAGINATLKSRCSLIAAANPEYGRFEQYEPIHEQIEIEPALMSRFDLIFTLTDRPDEERDTEIAEHILNTNMAEYNEVAGDEVSPEIEPELLRKYISYARENCKPQLTNDAKQKLRDEYVEIRGSGDGDAVPLSARKLQALVRLAEASARIRLSDQVEVEDAERAISVTRASLQEVGVDEEGNLDADIIEQGQSASKRQKHMSVVSFVQERADEVDSRGVPLQDIVEFCDRNFGMDKKEVEELVEELNRDGRVYQPKDSQYKAN